MADAWTVVIWTVTDAEAFVERWRQLAKWTEREGFTGRIQRLFRDLEDRRRFYSPIRWESVEEIERWRSHPGNPTLGDEVGTAIDLRVMETVIKP